MTGTFDNYARYYDLLYRDKDYSAEASYLHDLIQRYAPGAQSILELGCGTGGHAIHLAGQGYEVHGIDRSDRMIQRAEEDRKALPKEIARRLSFVQENACSYRAGRSFDAVLSLFHVISYQTSNEDLASLFSTAASHVRKDGVFLFDFWYGPAVLTIRPTARLKKMEDETISVTRFAEPKHFPNENRIDVLYDLYIREKRSGKVQQVQETHAMRYLFLPEILERLSAVKLSPVHTEEWMTGREPGYETWSVCSVSRK